MIRDTIQPGNKFCDRSLAHPLGVNLGRVTGIDFKLILNPSILFDLRSVEANNATQKLFGVSFGSNNHWNSWRLGWSMASVPNKKIYLRNYMYNKGVNLNTALKESWEKVDLSKGEVTISGSVRFKPNFHQIYLSIPSLNFAKTFSFDFTNVDIDNAFQQFFYVEIPGHKLMTLDSEIIYLR